MSRSYPNEDSSEFSRKPDVNYNYSEMFREYLQSHAKISTVYIHPETVQENTDGIMNHLVNFFVIMLKAYELDIHDNSTLVINNAVSALSSLHHGAFVRHIEFSKMIFDTFNMIHENHPDKMMSLDSYIALREAASKIHFIPLQLLHMQRFSDHPPIFNLLGFSKDKEWEDKITKELQLKLGRVAANVFFSHDDLHVNAQKKIVPCLLPKTHFNFRRWIATTPCSFSICSL